MRLRRVVECNVVQGLSRSIHEEVQFDRRSVKSVDWLTYPIVDITEAPPVIDVVLLNHPEAIATGAGEATMRPHGGGDQQRDLRGDRHAHYAAPR